MHAVTIRTIQTWSCPNCRHENLCQKDFPKPFSSPSVQKCSNCAKNFKFWINETAAGFELVCEDAPPTHVEVLCLLKYHRPGVPLFIIVHDSAPIKNDVPDLDLTYYFDEGTCPTNYLGQVLMICDEGDPDPHGVFQFVRAVPVEKIAKHLNVKREELFGCNNETLLMDFFHDSPQTKS